MQFKAPQPQISPNTRRFSCFLHQRLIPRFTGPLPVYTFDLSSRHALIFGISHPEPPPHRCGFADRYNTGARFNASSAEVHLKSQFILNGVCVVWRGWISLQRLDGMGRLEFDHERAQVEDALLREQIEQYNQRLRALEEQRQQQHEQFIRQRQSQHTESETTNGPLSTVQGHGTDAPRHNSRLSPQQPVVADDDDDGGGGGISER
ncbi:hypothetical protein LSH36_690g01023 [Paralvinella palmiformis]|uniref:Protein big brother n=1 Tax=Paralvinella palmiformis TaxID=53620 RepID=A0AAD9J371_9ANNE|nr:hypothetical protein LSH36_690g01023 [Paralvinella palmiformis]